MDHGNFSDIRVLYEHDVVSEKVPFVCHLRCNVC